MLYVGWAISPSLGCDGLADFLWHTPRYFLIYLSLVKRKLYGSSTLTVEIDDIYSLR